MYILGQSTIYKSWHFISSCSFQFKKNSFQLKKNLFQVKIKTFNSFLRSKSRDTTNISIQINDSIISDQRNVAEVFGDYLSTTASEIEGQHVLQLGEEGLNTLVSVEAICHSYHSLHFEFNKLDSYVQSKTS